MNKAAQTLCDNIAKDLEALRALLGNESETKQPTPYFVFEKGRSVVIPCGLTGIIEEVFLDDRKEITSARVAFSQGVHTPPLKCVIDFEDMELVS